MSYDSGFQFYSPYVPRLTIYEFNCPTVQSSMSGDFKVFAIDHNRYNTQYGIKIMHYN